MTKALDFVCVHKVVKLQACQYRNIVTRQQAIDHYSSSKLLFILQAKKETSLATSMYLTPTFYESEFFWSAAAFIFDTVTHLFL